MRYDREAILEAIRSTAQDNGGIPLGSGAFARVTGINRTDWRGVYWARWSDAVQEAGFDPNEAPKRMDEEQFLDKLATAVQHFGKVPTTAELRLYRRSNPSFPSHTTVHKHYRTMEALYGRLHAHAAARPSLEDVAALCEGFAGRTGSPVQATGTDGFVYLIKSGQHCKIGKSDNLERRIKEIRIALPEAATLVHVIRTDDADGIEAYWHRRFADRRANGEWFALAPSDIAAFKRRKFQ